MLFPNLDTFSSLTNSSTAIFTVSLIVRLESNPLNTGINPVRLRFKYLHISELVTRNESMQSFKIIFLTFSIKTLSSLTLTPNKLNCAISHFNFINPIHYSVTIPDHICAYQTHYILTSCRRHFL